MGFTFQDNPRRENTPMLVGLVGPSGCGKTLSALRLATGIRSVRGGKLVGIDTESGRMRHYADELRIDSYLEFRAPFSSERYTEALKVAAERAAGGVVIVDSMSHEHEGEGGYLEFHEAELDAIVKRYKGSDPEWKVRERNTFTGWIKPAAQRRRLINTILQLPCSFVFCFRAKEKLQIVPGGQPIQRGWQAIGGDEFAYEMTVRCLLQPGCNGVPDWSAEAFKLGVPKRGDIIKACIPDNYQLDEKVGEALADWAKGGGEQERRRELHEAAEEAARRGNAALNEFVRGLAKTDKATVKPFGSELRKLADRADATPGAEDDRQTAPVEPEDVNQDDLVTADVGREAGSDDDAGDDHDIDMPGL